MNIIVYDIAAASGGGETVLNQYIEKAQEDKNNQWWFIVSLPGLEDHQTDHVRILYRRELDARGAKRWLRRLLFENFKLPKIISEIKPDKVLSLQNMTMPKAKCHQTVYLHQSLQFAPVRFSFMKAEERAIAFRQRVICRLIRHNLKKADEVIVQTKWMKKATAKWANYPLGKINVQEPRISGMQVTGKTTGKRCRNSFFYPAGGSVYKNHKVIIDACILLKEEGITEYSVEFTLNPADNALTQMMFEEIKRKQLPISFIGYQPREIIYGKYAKQTLLFPSYIETYGLPLREAQQMGADIIVSDCEYAHEVLAGYEHCSFVAWNDAAAWARGMKKLIQQVR